MATAADESSTYAVELVRVLPDGQRLEVPYGHWEGYDWDELIGWRALQGPWRQRHAFSGVDAAVDYTRTMRGKYWATRWATPSWRC